MANAWDRFYRFHEAPWRGERPIAPLLAWLGSGPVLELGCGNGKLLRPLVAAGVDVVGLDVSFHALRRLGTGVLADAARLPFGDATFSAVLDIHCTGHLLEVGRREAIAEARRVLRPGGHLVVERLTPDDLRAHNGEEVEPHTRRLADGRTTHFSDEDELRRALAGWQVLDMQREERTMRLPGRSARRSSLRVVARREG